jgi:sortase B
MNDIKESSSKTGEKTSAMQDLENIQEENKEIVGWIEIEDTNINYPVLQTSNNDNTGSIFLDQNVDLDKGSNNYLIYGNCDDSEETFKDLLKYENEFFYKKHKYIRFITNNEDSTFEIMAIFHSNVTNNSDQYYFINADNETDYDNYVESAKKASIYDTGVNAKYGDTLLTLNTCENTETHTSFVIIAKKVTIS